MAAMHREVFSCKSQGGKWEGKGGVALLTGINSVFSGPAATVEVVGAAATASFFLEPFKRREADGEGFGMPGNE